MNLIFNLYGFSSKRSFHHQHYTRFCALQSRTVELQQGKPNLHGVLFTNKCSTRLPQMGTLSWSGSASDWYARSLR